MTFLTGMAARMARAPILSPVVGRIDHQLSQRQLGRPVTPWVKAADILGEDETLGRMFLDLLPQGFVAYAHDSDPTGTEGLSTWPTTEGVPLRATSILLQFDTTMLTTATSVAQ